MSVALTVEEERLLEAHNLQFTSEVVAPPMATEAELYGLLIEHNTKRAAASGVKLGSPRYKRRYREPANPFSGVVLGVSQAAHRSDE